MFYRQGYRSASAHILWLLDSILTVLNHFEGAIKYGVRWDELILLKQCLENKCGRVCFKVSVRLSSGERRKQENFQELGDSGIILCDYKMGYFPHRTVKKEENSTVLWIYFADVPYCEDILILYWTFQVLLVKANFYNNRLKK
jgi:hypothetical protein